MRQRRWGARPHRSIIGLGASLILGSTLVAAVPASATPLIGGGQIFVVTHLGTTLTLDVEGSDSIANVLQKIQDSIGTSPDDMCLTQDGQRYLTENTLMDYNVQEDSTLSEYLIPVAAVWSITPDEQFIGSIVSNAIITHPAGTHFDIIDGELPDGVTFDEVRGTVSGSFTSMDPFSVTIRATTICGDADIEWRTPRELANTGHDDITLMSISLGSMAAVGLGALLAWRRRRPNRG